MFLSIYIWNFHLSIHLIIIIMISSPSYLNKEIHETEVPYINIHTNPNIHNDYHINKRLNV